MLLYVSTPFQTDFPREWAHLLSLIQNVQESGHLSRICQTRSAPKLDTLLHRFDGHCPRDSWECRWLCPSLCQIPGLAWGQPVWSRWRRGRILNHGRLGFQDHAPVPGRAKNAIFFPFIFSHSIAVLDGLDPTLTQKYELLQGHLGIMGWIFFPTHKQTWKLCWWLYYTLVPVRPEWSSTPTFLSTLDQHQTIIRGNFCARQIINFYSE